MANSHPRLRQVSQAVTKSTCPQTEPLRLLLAKPWELLAILAIMKPRSFVGASLSPRSSICPKATACRDAIAIAVSTDGIL